MRLAAPLLLGTLLTGGCVAPRIHSELVRAGVPDAEAACLGRDLARDLSIGQLKRLGAAVNDAKRDRGTNTGPVRAAEVRDVAVRDGDPKTIFAVAKAGAHCALLPAVTGAPG